MKIEKFDWEMYLCTYPDLKEIGVDTIEKAKQHWLTYGKKQGRVIATKEQVQRLKKTFDWKTYVDYYPYTGIDTKEKSIGHWIAWGKRNKIILSRDEIKKKLAELRSSNEYKCIFIHIPKCAGTSIESVLFKEHQIIFDVSRGIWAQHATAKQIKQYYSSKDQWKSYFKFAIVRNPFDRVVSSYIFTCDKRGIEKNKLKFRDFVFKEGAFKDLLDCTKMHDPQNRYHQVMPAFDYLYDGDTLLVDFVGRFENLRQDWKEICERLGETIKLLI